MEVFCFLVILVTWSSSPRNNTLRHDLSSTREAPIQSRVMKLPGVAQEIADVIGRERALYLIGQLPRCVAGLEGKRSSRVIMYVPTLRRLRVTHDLVRILGWETAKRLCEHMGGEILCPANCSEVYRRFRDASIQRLARQGMRAREIAEVMEVSERHIRSLTAEIPQELIRRAANDNAAPLQPAKFA